MIDLLLFVFQALFAIVKWASLHKVDGVSADSLVVREYQAKGLLFYVVWHWMYVYALTLITWMLPIPITEMHSKLPKSP